MLHNDTNERPEHSWILDTDDEFSMAFFCEQDQFELRRIWKSQRSSDLIFASDDVFDGPDYNSCFQEITEIKKLIDDGFDCEDVYLHLLQLPLLREGEMPAKRYKMTIELRTAFISILKFWKDNKKVESEADYFQKMWNLIFAIAPATIETTSSETSMKASKYRKLCNEAKLNIRALQTDISWQTRTGITLAWAEGKKEGSTENHKEGDNAHLKSLKGAKDCCDFIILNHKHKVEVFSVTLLGNEFKLLSSTKLNSGASLCGTVFCHHFPTNFDGILLLLDIMKDFLKFLASMEKIGRTIYTPCNIPVLKTSTQMQTFTTPRKSFKIHFEDI
ncbi:hypothetical protein BDR26DRAFT_874432 [Obelidium mucronatum]|nr:hypothetical protein BDR26DRAFT_874432 [Obelidium mucronatum]